MEIWHTLLQYLEGQSIHNIFQYLEGCASQQDSMYCQYLQIPSPPPARLKAHPILQYISNTYWAPQPFSNTILTVEQNHPLGGLILLILAIGKHNFGPPKSETSNISILAGVGPGARVQYIAQYLQGWADKTQDQYLEGGKTSFPLILSGTLLSPSQSVWRSGSRLTQ